MYKTFKELIVWQKSHEMVLEIYKITKDFPKDELFVLASQIRRAAISVPANIVEGYRRKSLKESVNFYFIANASLEELRYHMLLSNDLGYIKENKYQEIERLINESSKLLNSWISSQKQYL
jgi:four helix bundle protein